MTQTKTTDYIAPAATPLKKARKANRPSQLERHALLAKGDHRQIPNRVARAYFDGLLQKINPKKRFFGKAPGVLHSHWERRLERVIATAVKLSKHARNKNGMLPGQVQKGDIELAYQLLKTH
jgi:histone H3/H4